VAGNYVVSKSLSLPGPACLSVCLSVQCSCGAVVAVHALVHSNAGTSPTDVSLSMKGDAMEVVTMDSEERGRFLLQLLAR